MENGHNYDAPEVNNLISYCVIDGKYAARLYIVPGKKMLYHHDGIISTIISSINIALEKHLNMRQLEHAAAVDQLTNCFNRRALDTFIENDVFYALRQKCDLSVIMFDLEDFKEINDCFGHSAGDAVLREIALLVRTMVRKSDYIVRYGGEEFVLVLRDTKLYDAVHLAHKIRKLVENHSIGYGQEILKVTASFGVASLEAKGDGKSLLLEADERLYASRGSGKNSVVPSLLPCFADKNFVTGRSVVHQGTICARAM